MWPRDFSREGEEMGLETEESFAFVVALGFEILVLLLKGRVFCDPLAPGPEDCREVLRAGGILRFVVSMPRMYLRMVFSICRRY